MQIPGSGTSASAPLFAALVARLLDAKVAAGKVRYLLLLPLLLLLLLLQINNIYQEE